MSRELQCSSPFLTSISGSLQSCNGRVRPRFVLRNGSPLASRVFHGEAVHLSNCIWNLQLFPDDANGVSVPLHLVTSSSVLHSKSCPGKGLILSAWGNQSVLEYGTTHEASFEFQYGTVLLLTYDRKVGIPFQTKQGTRPSCRD